MINAKRYTAQIAERDKNLKSVSEQNAKLEHAVDDLKSSSARTSRKVLKWPTAVFLGSIRTARFGSILGTADSLRRQVTFSVFDADLHDAAKSKKKGSIEVTRLLSDHMAEARITKDDPKNPILTGDNIYSQIWHRGKKLHFALTGLIDIDGDGQSDLQLARDLIELNGGIVDAYLDEAGKTARRNHGQHALSRIRRQNRFAEPCKSAAGHQRHVQRGVVAGRADDHAAGVPDADGLQAARPHGAFGRGGQGKRFPAAGRERNDWADDAIPIARSDAGRCHAIGSLRLGRSFALPIGDIGTTLVEQACGAIGAVARRFLESCRKICSLEMLRLDEQLHGVFDAARSR